METLIVVVIVAVVAGLMGRSAYRTLTHSSRRGGCACGETECPAESLCLTANKIPWDNLESPTSGESESGQIRNSTSTEEDKP